jgi:small subunit ribosomal protein S16
MSVKLRLARFGAKKRPYYHIVAADSRAPRDGSFIEQVGTYNPMVERSAPDAVRLNGGRIEYWLGQGAKPTDRVARFLAAAGLIPAPALDKQTKRHLPKAKAQERMKAIAAAAEAKAAESAAAADAEAKAFEAAKEEAAAAPAESSAATEAEAQTSKPAEPAPAEAAPVESAPAEAAPAEAAPVEPAPAEAAPVESAVSETKAIEPEAAAEAKALEAEAVVGAEIAKAETDGVRPDDQSIAA